MTQPPDRSHILTEQRNPRSMGLHGLNVRGCVELFNRENAEVLRAMDEAAPALTAFIEAVEPRFLRGGRLIYVGAGTSGRLAVLDASECPPTFQIPPGRVVGIIAGGDAALRVSSEGKEDDPDGARAELEALRLTPDDAVLGIAAGGTTPYVLGALALAKSLAQAPSLRHSVTPSLPLTGLLSCSPVTKPAAADHLIVLPTGPELLTGSTRLKAGTATKLALNTITTTLMVRSGRVYQNLMVDVRATNAKLRDRAARIVSTITGATRDEAFALLDGAGGSVKTAVVMRARGLDRAAAEARLAEAGGRLDAALGS
jgi:N-acetylmuramic acid 6-phosphate etherase